MFEAEAILLIIFVAYQDVSLMSMGFLLLSNILLWSATFSRKDRLTYGKYFTLALILGVILEIFSKMYMARSIRKLEDADFDRKCMSLIDIEDYYEAWGFPERMFKGFKNETSVLDKNPCTGLRG